MRKRRATLLTLLILLVSGLATVAAAPVDAASAPVIHVSRTSGLARGDVVKVWAGGLTGAAPVRVVQCDVFVDDPESDCQDTQTDTTTTAGNLFTTVRLGDPVYRQQPFGDPTPVYCRADMCRLFLVWDDATGTRQVLASPALRFTGSPATVSVTPSTGLPDAKWVWVRGTAHGAEGRVVKVLEQGCFQLVQGSGCYGSLPARWATVDPWGHFAVTYPARRFLGDDAHSDCTDPDLLGTCGISVVVLDRLGRHDDTFGVRDLGAPFAALRFGS